MTTSPLYIQTYCKIENNTIVLNGDTVFVEEAVDFKLFMKSAYKEFGVNYPKFFKMDSLSKLALMAAELVLKEVSELEKENIGLVFANSSSSLDTDIAHQESIQDSANYFPSPAVFVYTLPNICLGEISIKQQLKSEHAFFIFDTFNAEFINQYAEALIMEQKSNQVVCGWVDYLKGTYKAFVYLVGTKGTIELTKENTEKLYT